MSRFTWSHRAIKDAVAVTPAADAPSFDLSGFSQCLLSVDLSAKPTEGTALVVLEYKNANNVWRPVLAIPLSSSTDAVVPVVKLTDLSFKTARIRVSAYSGFLASATPVAITVCLDAS